MNGRQNQWTPQDEQQFNDLSERRDRVLNLRNATLRDTLRDTRVMDALHREFHTVPAVPGSLPQAPLRPLDDRVLEALVKCLSYHAGDVIDALKPFDDGTRMAAEVVHALPG